MNEEDVGTGTRYEWVGTRYYHNTSTKGNNSSHGVMFFSCRI